MRFRILLKSKMGEIHGGSREKFGSGMWWQENERERSEERDSETSTIRGAVGKRERTSIGELLDFVSLICHPVVLNERLYHELFSIENSMRQQGITEIIIHVNLAVLPLRRPLGLELSRQIKPEVDGSSSRLNVRI
jgi:hypothetical protein